MAKLALLCFLALGLVFAEAALPGPTTPATFATATAKPKPSAQAYHQLRTRAHKAAGVIWKAQLPQVRNTVAPGLVLNVRGRNHPLVGVYRGPQGVVQFTQKFKKMVYSPGRQKREPQIKKVLCNVKKHFCDFHMTKAMLGANGKTVIKNFAWISRYTMGPKGLKVVKMSVFVTRGFKTASGKPKPKGPKDPLKKKRKNPKVQSLIDRSRLASHMVWKAKVGPAKNFVEPGLILRVNGPKGHPLAGVYRGAAGVVDFTRKFKKMVYNPGKQKREPKVARVKVFPRMNRVDYHMTKEMLGPDGKTVIKNFSWIARYTMKGKKIVRMSVFVKKGFKQITGKQGKGKSAPPPRKSP